MGRSAALWLSLVLCVAPSVSFAAEDPEVLFRQGRVSEALQLASAQAAADPTDLAAQELMIDVLLNVGQQPRAEQVAKRRLDDDPGNPDAHYLLGRARVDPLASRQAYEAALHLSPSHARAHMGMGSIHEASSDLDEAAAAYARAASMDPSLGEAWYGHTRILAQQGKLAAALQVARAGLAAVPSEPGLPLLVARLDPPSAVPVLQAALAQVEADPYLHEALAAALLTSGDAGAAVSQATAALALNPNLLDARRTLLFAREVSAGVLPHAQLAAIGAARELESTDPAGALARYPAILSAAPRSAMATLSRAAAHRAAGDRASELADLRAAAALDPTNDEVAAVTGLALIDAGQAADAVPHLTTAMSQRPWDSTLGLGLATALSAAGHAVDALVLLDRVGAAHPQNVAVQLAHAQALIDAGQHARAYGVLKVAMQVVPDPRLVAAFVKVAPLAGHAGEAAAVLAPVAEQTSNPALADAVRQLRAMAGDP